MSLTKDQVAALYVAVFNRAPDAAGLTYWTEEFEGTYAEAAAGFTSHPQFEIDYDGLSNEQIVEKFYTNILGGVGDAEGIAYWTAMLEDGATEAEVLAEFLDATLAYDGDDAAALARQATLENRIDVGLFFATKLGEDSNVTNPDDLENDPAYLRSIEVLENVTSDPATVITAKDLVNEWAEGEQPEPEPVEGEEILLEVGRDNLKGTDGDDTFIADIVQNGMGLQVNTLGTGDRLDGLGGKDVLEAQVTAGAYAGGFANMAIQARTKNIERIELEAVNSNAHSKGQSGTDGGPGDQVYLNAKDMENVSYIGSERSNADLTIQDLTSKGVAGGVKNMTVGMKYTGNADTRWDESDLNVYFDQDYLTRESDTQNGWSYEILNQESWDLNTSEPVKGFPLERITFTLEVDGVETKYTLSLTADDRAAMSTQAGLVDILNAKLAEQDVSGLEFELGADFTDGDGRTSQSINLVNTDDNQEIVNGTVGLDEDSPSGNLYWNNKILADVVTLSPTSVNVELEKVGRAGDGGELVIGSMNKTSDNEWDAVNTVGENTVSGIEEFNVTVAGGKAESSSLAGLHSTNNNLRTVNVVSAEGSNANLTIGNSNTTDGLGNPSSLDGLDKANALKDVQTFNAEGFKGDLNVSAALTDEVTDKYLQDGSATENFVYTGGTGNDTFDVALSSANLAASGNTTHGYFNFEINSGAGNDTITVGVYDGSGLADAGAGAAPWYLNQKTNENLSINAGEGDDTVNLQGSGDWIVDLGAGNDVIYVDNAGGTIDTSGYTANTDNLGTFDVDPTNESAAKASWIFNTTTAPTAYNIEADGTVANGWLGAVGGGNTTHNLYHAGITLTLTDDEGGQFELNLSVAPDVGSPVAYRTSQKAINEAIKAAIENDPVFSKLVEAQTGQMADTLIINSLIDGDVVDLGIAFNQLASGASSTVIADFNSKYGASVTSAGLTNAYTNSLNPPANQPDTTTANTAFTTNSAKVTGSDGDTFGYQIITGGAGDDVFVLGTSGDQLHTLVYEGYGNGTDTILNFVENTATSGPATEDVLDLTSYNARYVDFGKYAPNGDWQSGVGHNAGNDYGKGTSNNTNLAVNNTFLRVNEDDTGVYTIEAFKVTVAGGDVSGINAPNIQSLGTVGTLDFGQNTDLNNLDFII